MPFALEVCEGINIQTDTNLVFLESTAKKNCILTFLEQLFKDLHSVLGNRLHLAENWLRWLDGKLEIEATLLAVWKKLDVSLENG